VSLSQGPVLTIGNAARECDFKKLLQKKQVISQQGFSTGTQGI